MKVRFTPAARRDLRAIADWIARNDRGAALRFTEMLSVKALEIGAMPHAFPAIERRGPDILRKRSFRNYVIIYRVQTEVEIVHVVDARRDYLPLLDDL